jgi:hypothetical protein
MTLTGSISNKPVGPTMDRQVVLFGTAYNSDPEGAFVNGGLRAFYFTPSGREVWGTALPVGDPAAGTWSGGRNSEFAANPWNSSNWWLTDNAAFRAANGIAGTPTNTFNPPYIINRIVNQVADGGDDQASWDNNYGIRMEGRIVIPADTTYTFNGGGDDWVWLYVDGYPVFREGYFGWERPITLKAGEHGFTAQFGEGGGSQNYSFGLPAGATLKANAPDEHTYSGYTVEYGRTFAEQRPGMLTMKFTSGSAPGGAQIGTLGYFKGTSYQEYGNDLGPAPQQDNYRMLMAGYWNVPTSGFYDFGGGADDRYGLAVSNDPNADPWALPRIMSNDGGLPTSIAGVYLTAGWKPFRMEFGEGGGGANFWLRYKLSSSSTWAYFQPADFLSTADPVYDWTLLALGGDQFSIESQLLGWIAPVELLGIPLDFRLRVFDTNLGYIQDSFSVILTPEPASAGLLALAVGALLAGRRRRGNS